MVSVRMTGENRWRVLFTWHPAICAMQFKLPAGLLYCSALRCRPLGLPAGALHCSGRC